MISALDRRRAVELIEEACRNGARRWRACRELAISLRTYQRWRCGEGVRVDRRPTVQRPEPANKLTPEERARVLAICHQAEFASLPPSQIVPRLADGGDYVASESSFYRILREADEGHRRGRARAPRPPVPVPSHCARRPCQVWTWDITWLAGPVRGLFYYLYLIIDLYSRKIVGWEVYERESADYASIVVRRAVLAEGCVNQPLILHADNGAPQKGSTLRVTLETLGIEPSYSRPRVSDDNPFSEAIFRTCKYRPDYPYQGFADVDAARCWVGSFVDWYNHEHCHSGIRFVTPAQRHVGADAALLAKRKAVYEKAKARHPERWTGKTRNWEPVTEVWLNPNNTRPEKRADSQKAA